MRALVPALSVVLGLAIAGPAPAQAMSNMKGMDMSRPAAKTGQTTGVIKAIDQRAATLTIQHGPIAGLGWPAMTMTFKATSPSLLNGIKAGDHVRFSVRVEGDSYLVTAIAKQL